MNGAMWDTFESRLLLTAQLRAKSALRIGAGGDNAAQPTASDLPVIVDGNDRPYIPGSSLRGVIRSHTERILRSLLGKRGACDPTSEANWCITDEQMKKWRETFDSEAALAAKVWEHSCHVCRVYGSTWLASRVRIADLHLLETQQPRIERRDGVSIHREKETVQHKYDFETVASASLFQLRIVAENLSDAERGLLWLGLRELRDGSILIGGFKGRGLGLATLEELTIQAVESADKQALREFILKGTLVTQEPTAVDGWLATFWREIEDAKTEPDAELGEGAA